MGDIIGKHRKLRCDICGRLGKLDLSSEVDHKKALAPLLLSLCYVPLLKCRSNKYKVNIISC